MKNKKAFFIILLLLILGLVGWWFWWSKSAESGPSLKPHVAASSANAETNRFPMASQSTAQDTATPTSQTEVRIDPSLPDSTKLQMILDARNGNPINVYGKVVDQYAAPVVGAMVKGGTLLISADASGGQKLTTQTDAQGQFSFTGLHGVRFGLVFEKAGYEYNPGLYLGWWDHYKPDPANPMVFTMYKLQGAEPMVKARIYGGLPVDGTETHFDLLTGQKVTTSGDLIVKLTRNPIDVVRGKHFDWSITFQIVDGGLVGVADVYPNEAPENGYQPSITVDMPTSAKNWTDDYSGFFYFKARNGKVYGRIKFSLGAGFQPPPADFGADIYANPAGSRNLEYDRSKRIVVPGAFPLVNLD